MTLVTRSAVRLSRRGNQAIKSARANAAFFNTAATQGSNLLPKARAESSRMRMPTTSGESCSMIYECTGGIDTMEEQDSEGTRAQMWKERGSLGIMEKVRSDIY